jgi:hypothetical protein
VDDTHSTGFLEQAVKAMHDSISNFLIIYWGFLKWLFQKQEIAAETA